MENQWSKEELAHISGQTVGHYQENAIPFKEGTWDHDVSQNRKALLQAIEGSHRPHILDFGCGPGRDLVAFMEQGVSVAGLDGAAAFCEMAREASKATVYHQDFLALDLPEEHFDGIFANATLFHIPSTQISRVLGELRDALKPHGVLFSSNPRGEDQEGWNGDRYGTYYRPETWTQLLEDAGFQWVREYYRPPGKPRVEQPWFASVWRKKS